MLHSGFEKPSTFNTIPDLLSFPSSPFFVLPHKPSSHLPSLSATRNSTQLNSITHPKTLEIPTTEARNLSIARVFWFSFYMESNFLIKIWVGVWFFDFDTRMGATGSKLEKALGDQFPEGERYFGLENFGNTCYCNSVLQVCSLFVGCIMLLAGF